MNKKDGLLVILVFTIVPAVVWLQWNQEETIREMSSLAEGLPGIGHGMLRITLSNGTHLIHSILLFENESNEIVEQDHFLLKVDEEGYSILEVYKELKEIPNYQTFMPTSEGSP